MDDIENELKEFAEKVALAIWTDPPNETAYLLRHFQEVSIAGAWIYAGALAGLPEYFRIEVPEVHDYSWWREIIEKMDIISFWMIGFLLKKETHHLRTHLL